MLAGQQVWPGGGPVTVSNMPLAVGMEFFVFTRLQQAGHRSRMATSLPFEPPRVSRSLFCLCVGLVLLTVVEFFGFGRWDAA